MSSPPSSAMPNDRPGSVTEIVPGALYAVGARLDEATPVPWLPQGGRGDLPIQAYAFRSEDKLVLIDGGLSIHRAARKGKPSFDRSHDVSDCSSAREAGP